jgi:hypothetical protein
VIALGAPTEMDEKARPSVAVHTTEPAGAEKAIWPRMDTDGHHCFQDVILTLRR